VVRQALRKRECCPYQKFCPTLTNAEINMLTCLY
jgi:hypothetical protein